MLKKIISNIILFLVLLFSQCRFIFAQSPSLTPIASPNPSLSPSLTPTIKPSPTATLTLAPTVTPTATPITEIIIYSANACPSNQNESIQLQNLSSQQIILQDWKIGDLTSSRDIINSLTFSNLEVKEIILEKVKLNNSGDEIFLYDQNNNLVDQVTYPSCKEDELIFFHQPSPTVTPSPSANPSPNPSQTPTPVKTNSNEETNNSTASSNLNSTSTPSQTINKKINYPAYNLKNIPQQTTVESIVSPDLIVENILYKEIKVSQVQIASVIITGVILIWLGLFFDYETKKFN